MSNENPTPASEPQPSATQPTPPAPQPAEVTGTAPAQQPYQAPGHGQVQYQYVQRSQRPPLSKRAKSGATWAGIIGFNMLTVGFFVFFLPLALLAAGSLFALVIAEAMRQGTAEFSGGFEWLTTLDPTLMVVPLLIVSAVGLIIWIVALIISRAILRSSGAVKPWAITWAAAGIAIVAYWIIWTIIGFIGGIISSFLAILTQSFGDPAVASLISGVVSILLAIIINSIIGWLCWLWMAHAMRPTHEQLAVEGMRQ